MADDEGGDRPPQLSGNAQLGVVFSLIIILGTFLLVVVLGPLLDRAYKIETLIVVGVAPVVLGAILLAMGVKLPDWWNKR